MSSVFTIALFYLQLDEVIRSVRIYCMDHHFVSVK